VKVNRDAAVELFCQLGLKTAAPKWTDEVLLGKIKTLAEIVRARGKEGLPKKGSKSFTLLAELITAMKNGEQITLTGGDAAGKKPGKAKPKAEPEEDDGEEGEVDDDTDGEEDDDDDAGEDEDDEDADTGDDDGADDEEEDDSDEDGDDDGEDSDDESDDDSDTDEEDDDVTEAPAKKVPAKKPPAPAPATKPAKPGKPPVKEPGKAPPAKKGGDGKPGIIASIVEFIQEATPDKPISKKQILDKLVKRFKDGDADGMMKTINAQVPNRLIQQKGLDVVKTDDKRFYIRPAKSGKKAK
jgi:hypothetical protein